MKNQNPHPESVGTTASPTATQEKQPFSEPKLTFVPPKLTKQGDVADITAQSVPGFFGSFSP